MNRWIRLLLVLLGASLVFGPFLLLEGLGGREAIVILTGTQPNGLLLGASYFVSWVWLVFASVPFIAGATVLVLSR